LSIKITEWLDYYGKNRSMHQLQRTRNDVMQQFKVEKLPHQQEYRINGEQKQLMHFPSYSVSNAHDSSNEK